MVTGNATTPTSATPTSKIPTAGKQRRRRRLPVPIFRVWLAGTTTWRSQCLRPGVTNCKEYDLAQTPPTGISIDFTATVPYLGLSLNADVFPLARLRQPNRSRASAC